jgi:hypothetical protein
MILIIRKLSHALFLNHIRTIWAILECEVKSGHNCEHSEIKRRIFFQTASVYLFFQMRGSFYKNFIPPWYFDTLNLYVFVRLDEWLNFL